MTTEIHTGDLVTIEGKAGKVEHAEVVDVRDARDMPSLPIPESDLARQFILEDYLRVAAIDYLWLRREGHSLWVRMVALQDFKGVWWDVQGHAITIVKEQERVQ